MKGGGPAFSNNYCSPKTPEHRKFTLLPREASEYLPPDLGRRLSSLLAAFLLVDRWGRWAWSVIPSLRRAQRWVEGHQGGSVRASLAWETIWDSRGSICSPSYLSTWKADVQLPAPPLQPQILMWILLLVLKTDSSSWDFSILDHIENLYCLVWCAKWSVLFFIYLLSLFLMICTSFYHYTFLCIDYKFRLK